MLALATKHVVGVCSTCTLVLEPTERIARAVQLGGQLLAQCHTQGEASEQLAYAVQFRCLAKKEQVIGTRAWSGSE